jgi:hypothetical protein
MCSLTHDNSGKVNWQSAAKINASKVSRPFPSLFPPLALFLPQMTDFCSTLSLLYRLFYNNNNYYYYYCAVIAAIML